MIPSTPLPPPTPDSVDLRDESDAARAREARAREARRIRSLGRALAVLGVFVVLCAFALVIVGSRRPNGPARTRGPVAAVPVAETNAGTTIPMGSGSAG